MIPLVLFCVATLFIIGDLAKAANEEESVVNLLGKTHKEAASEIPATTVSTIGKRGTAHIWKAYISNALSKVGKKVRRLFRDYVSHRSLCRIANMSWREIHASLVHKNQLKEGDLNKLKSLWKDSMDFVYDRRPTVRLPKNIVELLRLSLAVFLRNVSAEIMKKKTKETWILDVINAILVFKSYTSWPIVKEIEKEMAEKKGTYSKTTTPEKVEDTIGKPDAAQMNYLIVSPSLVEQIDPNYRDDALLFKEAFHESYGDAPMSDGFHKYPDSSGEKDIFLDKWDTDEDATYKDMYLDDEEYSKGFADDEMKMEIEEVTDVAKTEDVMSEDEQTTEEEEIVKDTDNLEHEGIAESDNLENGEKLEDKEKIEDERNMQGLDILNDKLQDDSKSEEEFLEDAINYGLTEDLENNIDENQVDNGTYGNKEDSTDHNENKSNSTRAMNDDDE